MIESSWWFSMVVVSSVMLLVGQWKELVITARVSLGEAGPVCSNYRKDGSLNKKRECECVFVSEPMYIGNVHFVADTASVIFFLIVTTSAATCRDL